MSDQPRPVTWKQYFSASRITMIGVVICMAVFIAHIIAADIRLKRDEKIDEVAPALLAKYRDDVATGRLLGRNVRELDESIGPRLALSYSCDGTSEDIWYLRWLHVEGPPDPSGARHFVEGINVVSHRGVIKQAVIRERRKQ